MDRATPEIRRWIAALALMMPAAIPYAIHILEWKPHSLPTGYIQPDMPIYMAKVRETKQAAKAAAKAAKAGS